MAYDGKVVISTKLDNKGFTDGLAGLKSSVKRFAATVGIAFGTAAIINFGRASVKAASDMKSAYTGLQSIVEGQGRSFKDAQAFIQDYISDGLIPATNAVTAYKNLAMRGYDDTQIQQVMIALKNSSAYGRQAALTMGEAVSGATEGLKNENSMLVDNAGVTKNVSMMWKDYAASIGTTADKLTQQQKIQAEVSGILHETRYQMGDAAKVAGDYAGQVQGLQFACNNFKVALGNMIIPILQVVIPAFKSMISAATKLLNVMGQVTGALFGTSANQYTQVADA
ncbi:MAG: hypothetical protein RSF86_14190, partial [Angelakisella sp.]